MASTACEMICGGKIFKYSIAGHCQMSDSDKQAGRRFYLLCRLTLPTTSNRLDNLLQLLHRHRCRQPLAPSLALHYQLCRQPLQDRINDKVETFVARPPCHRPPAARRLSGFHQPTAFGKVAVAAALSVAAAVADSPAKKVG